MKLLKLILMALSVLTVSTCSADIPPMPRNWKAQISYLANGGTGKMSVQKVKPGKTFKVKDCKFKRQNYLFTGWKSFDYWYYPRETLTAYYDMTFIAQWQYDRYAWMNRATTHRCAFYVFSGSGNDGKWADVTIKVGRRNTRTGIAKVTVTVKFTNESYKYQLAEWKKGVWCNRKPQKTNSLKGDLHVGDGWVDVYSQKKNPYILDGWVDFGDSTFECCASWSCGIYYGHGVINK